MIPTSGEAIAPMRKEDVPRSAEADPADCRTRIRARVCALGSVTPIADIRTNNAAATGASPTSPNTPVVISSRAVAASTITARPTARTRSRRTRPTSTLPLTWPISTSPTEFTPNSRPNVCGEAP